MGEKLTRIRLKGKRGGGYGWMDWGEHSFEDMLRQIRSRAQSELEQASAVLAASDDDFEVAVVRGSIVQHHIRDVLPAALSRHGEGNG